ncbi:hypothetical protein GCM10023345_27080 [Acinetobacter kookii]|jgi:hypothetical protein|uniref:Uncharacterized protein n=1 Tax=Acinetobacter kookii TaxID=1226327 RepID=A0A1G6KQL0_9GAMM|nr:hypothetical protein [Acinetobacter kookii]SDC33340.1 hypothetical protein SAMN05421732_105103 [Acinetobacter kookii]
MSITRCESINDLINLALNQGNSVLEITHSWSEMEAVVYMSQPITLELKNAGMKYEDLTYYTMQGSPHTKPDEGFYSKSAKIAISFPSSL